MGQVRHGCALSQSCNTAIACYNRDAEPGTRYQCQNGRQMAQALRLKIAKLVQRKPAPPL